MFVLCKLPSPNKDLSHAMQWVIMALAEAWAEALQEKPLPKLYSTKTKYRPEPLGALCEEWVDPYTTHKRGYGDCDDLVIWRLAEILNEKGYKPSDGARNAPAWPAIARVRGTGRYHVVIRHRDGSLEDPAATMRDNVGELPPKELRNV